MFKTLLLLLTLSTLSIANDFDANQWEYYDNCREEVLLQYDGESKELIKELLDECKLETTRLYDETK